MILNSRLRMLRSAFLPLFVGCITLLNTASFAYAREKPAFQKDSLTLDTTAVGPVRFIAAHGRRALISGYASDGLEIWAYPFQILENYRVSFRPVGTTTPIEGKTVLRRVIYSPDSITRIYLGPGFTVHETLFVPLNEPAAILSYAVESEHPVDIEVYATPVLNLMWPASVGGQSTLWSSSIPAFLIRQPSSGFSAFLGSPEIIDHDDRANRTNQTPNVDDFSFTLRPSVDGLANVYVALISPSEHNPETLFRRLVQEAQPLRAEYDKHIRALTDTMLKISTPDNLVNSVIAWSEIALDQAWVCNIDLGCGYVAGYGPSRAVLRPQYDWFFAGDGLVAANAALDAGNSTQARKELEFILHYQDKKTGMIWHELSQSAGFIDWAGKYPYMYVHVDITFQLLPVLAHYITETGDVSFARAHWSDIEAAYRYCESLIDPATGLPHIPLDKEGGNEQDRMSEDLGLSVSWVEASSSFQQLASLTDHGSRADEAAKASRYARATISSRYWDPQHSFWINGYSDSGTPVEEQRSSPTQAITMNVFTPPQNERLLDQLASASFQTDWGSRGLAAGSKNFDPASYSKGSVSALGTSELAATFWSEHRSVAAFSIWSSLLSWSSLDSLGRFHEVLTGDIYRPQEESVPEQTWSSAGFLNATVCGLLGLGVNAVNKHLTFAPHLPGDWHDVKISHIPLGEGKVSLSLHQDLSELILKVNNQGEPFQLEFAPSLALGAKVGAADFNHQSLKIKQESHTQDTVASVSVKVMRGENILHIALHGGISVITKNLPPMLGEPSHGTRIIDAHLEGDSLIIDADVPAQGISTIELQTEWKIIKAKGAILDSIAPNVSRITFVPPRDRAVINRYQRLQVVIQLIR